MAGKGDHLNERGDGMMEWIVMIIIMAILTAWLCIKDLWSNEE